MDVEESILNRTQDRTRGAQGHALDSPRAGFRLERLSQDPLALAAVATSVGFLLGALLMSLRRPKNYYINVEEFEVEIENEE